jgi:hypothetical protein
MLQQDVAWICSFSFMSNWWDRYIKAAKSVILVFLSLKGRESKLNGRNQHCGSSEYLLGGGQTRRQENLAEYWKLTKRKEMVLPSCSILLSLFLQIQLEVRVVLNGILEFRGTNLTPVF